MAAAIPRATRFATIWLAVMARSPPVLAFRVAMANMSPMVPAPVTLALIDVIGCPLGAVMSLKLRPSWSKPHADAVASRKSVSGITADPQLLVAMVT